MQRHKMHHVFGQTSDHEDSQADGQCGPSENDFSARDAMLNEDGMLFGQASAPETSQEAEGNTVEVLPPETPSQDNAEERWAAELAEMRLRTAAEMDNFKKRLSREHEEQMRYATEKVLSDLLPTLDNLDLALRYGSKSEACKDMLQGVAMTHKLLLDAVMKHGLKPLGEEGEEFNPSVHEAVGFEDRPELAPNSVARVLQSGYKLGERLLRPARVMVRQ